jgi:hypothetical protein
MPSKKRLAIGRAVDRAGNFIDERSLSEGYTGSVGALGFTSALQTSQ